MKILNVIRTFFILCTCLQLNANQSRLLSQNVVPSLYALPTPNALQIHYFQKNVPVSAQEQILIDHVKKSINDSFLEKSAITNEISHNIPGMSSPKVRHLLNNLCTCPHTNYLEIGLWHGATFISALYNNYTTIDRAVGMDNWSQFGGPKNEFDGRAKYFLPKKLYKYDTYSLDCFATKPLDIIKTPINIYFYDGSHSALDQKMAFTHYNSIFENTFVALIDDWNEECIRSGTLNAFTELNYQILFEIDLPGHSDNTLWWNGLYVAVIRKA
jgi:hypothetical protein